MLNPSRWRWLGLLCAFVSFFGCSLTPAGTEIERAHAAAAGREYEANFEVRSLPELPPDPTWQNILQRAFLANGELEAKYFEWRATVVRIGVASAYPNSNLSLGYSYTFSSTQMKSFDRMAFSAAPDSMTNLSLPSKVTKAGEVALEEARASGERFRAAKFNLQRQVFFALGDYYLAFEKARIGREQLALLLLIRNTANARLETGGDEQELLKADISYHMAEDAVQNADTEISLARVLLNGLLARDPSAEIPVRRVFDERRLPFDDAALFKIAVSENPELSALAHDVKSRGDALELARLQWIPDFNPTAVFAGGLSQAIGVGIVLPTTISKIRGEIQEADAALRSAEAMLRQVTSDRRAQFVASLVSLRNAERQSMFFQDKIIPVAKRLSQLALESYIDGGSSLITLADAEKTLLEAELVQVEAHVMREKRLSELEALMGSDIEALGGRT